MSVKKIIAFVTLVIGLGLLIGGLFYKLSFNKSQDDLLALIEQNIHNEEITIDIPDKVVKKAITEYEKASKKDPEQFPPLTKDDIVFYKTNKAKSTGIVEIPSIKVKAGVIEGVSPRELAISAGRYTTSATPDKNEGNLVIAGHVSGPVPVFAKLNKVKVGDEIRYTYKGITYEYIVTDKFIAEPTQIEILDCPPGKKMITLFTCANNGKQRTVIQAEAVN